MALQELLSRLELDEQGRLILNGIPMIITTREFIALVQKIAEEVLGEMGAATLMYRAGFQAARSFAEAQARIFGLRGFDILDKYLEVASVRGWWSRYEVLERSEEPLRVRVRLYNTIAEEWGTAGRAVCHLWRGGLAGIVKFIAESMGKQVDVRGREVACIAKGDPYCEIVVEQVG
ncbi:hypothetical protein DRO33_00185 [Candidatus Bathyarchaeota archaeon]|nr:MAG: hypothetical protein DRO33_00185 [Candidatus Bathyarchaeota archaeon]